MRGVFLDYATVSRGDLDLAALRAALGDLTVHEFSAREEIAPRIAGCEVIITNKLVMDRDLIAANPALRLIAVTATGTNNIDLEAARARGVAVCNVRDYCTTSVVQHVLGAMLLLTHGLREHADLVARGRWRDSPQFTMLAYPIRELRGRKLGVVGFGTLGRAVARAAEAALGMQVLVAARAGAPAADGRIPLLQLLREADVLTLHCPLTDETRNLLDRERLALMKRDAIIVNTARGALIDSHALAGALRAGALAGAAIDVLPSEPPVDGDPLLATDIPNLIVTPHIAWAAREARQRCIDEVAGNILAFARGERRNRVD
ncbi:MAG: NAD(P)-dependent oxidoreductase [Steroidobacteraceae bacterium]